MRGAFFQLLCALCEFTPGLVVAQAALLCPAVLLNIDDTDPAVLPSVWEAVLHVMSTVPVSLRLLTGIIQQLQMWKCHFKIMSNHGEFSFFSLLQDCWTHVNAKKGFLPKLWALLKEGGKGMAKALHPNLMPLLSKLPHVVTHPSLDFYSTFFTSFIQG